MSVIRNRLQAYVIWGTIALGILLRFADIGLPDMATDEAQFALGASAAQPPAGMALFRVAQLLFGPHILAVRGVSVLLGTATVILIYLIARTLFDKKSSLIVAAVASIFPGHILFSRLAYLSVPLCFAWTLTLLSYLKAKNQDAPLWLLALFLSSLLATFTKTQGLLLPGVLLLGSVIETRGRCAKDGVCQILFLSLIPIGLYIITNTGILATLFFFGGSTYGLHNFFDRIALLLETWWSLLPIFLIVMVVGIQSVKFLPWPVWSLIAIGTFIGLVLGPNHAYYTTYLIYWSLPIGISLAKNNPLRQSVALTVLVVGTLVVLTPVNSLKNPWTYDLLAHEGYWNTHATRINELLSEENRVVTVGAAGHHIRWYLEPRVLVGDTMNLLEWRGMILVLDKNLRETAGPAEPIYQDDQILLLRRE